MNGSNIIAFLTGVTGGLISLAMLSVIVAPNSQAATLIKESANAFTGALTAARGSKL